MIVEVDALTRQYARRNAPPFVAVDRVSFAIGAGERVAFIGPNGAGKSTTLKMLTGILHPTSGHAEVAGHVPWRHRRRLAYDIGIVFGQRSQLWYHLPVRDSFDLLAKIYAVDAAQYKSRAAHIADTLRIGDLLAQPVRSLSLGQRMRCEIAAALLHRPKVLFLDEPTIGLDVTAKALLREHLRHLAETEDTTVMLTSHDTGDIEEICDRVILIDHGRILLDRPLAALRAEFMAKRQVTLVTAEETPVLAMDGAEVIAREPHRLVLSLDPSRCPVDRLVGEALRTLTVRDLAIENAPLETIIRSLYGGAP